MIRDEGMLEQLLSTIRDFVKNELIPRENEVVEKDKIPDDIVQQMREPGFIRPHNSRRIWWPRHHYGRGSQSCI